MDMVHQVFHKTLGLWIYATESEAEIAAQWFMAKTNVPVSEMGIVTFPRKQLKPDQRVTRLGL
jgi:hypothetical protein